MKVYEKDRRKRIELLKKLIIIVPSVLFISLIAAIVVLCIVLSREKKQNTYLTNELEGFYDQTVEYDENSGVYDVSGVDVVKNADYIYADDSESFDKERKIYLTFDDGPSIYTDDILDILKEYDVKATFFVVAKDDEKSLNAYKRIVDEGHTLAMHSYTHRYTQIYKDLDSFKKDITSLQEFLYDVTGVWCRIYRFPGGSSNRVSKVPIEELIQYLNEEGITYFDWNAASGDARSTSMLSVETLKINSVKDIDKYEDCVILMHDASTKRSSVDALPGIIEYILSREDCVILPITDETEPIQHVHIEK